MGEQALNVIQHIENETIKLASMAGEGSITELDLSLLKSWIEKIGDSNLRAKYEKIVNKIKPIGKEHQIKQITKLMLSIFEDANISISFEQKNLGEKISLEEGQDLMRSFCEFLTYSASVIDQPRLSDAEIDELQKQMKGFGDASGDALEAKFYIFLDLYNSIINP